ncbi:hypothetical protein [Streptomyces lonarensis]|uniref:MinD-like ATPase involved in chromosome partitioning or flagellar assembly n=1 Tax=Streptomyces lonarensis TaxID=700599 RepID=A0A7X6CY98_9ACTN|nr:hypothetical protein [Streptomyces lonarensis]NJQ04645.1 hypothetical protein [Streptomyces lonarensis]
MALIAVAADKGSPGATTTAVALAALWPRRALLAEVDPAGGDLVYRSAREDGRPLDPGTGLLSLAATARRGIAAEQLWDHSQRVSGGLDVIVGLTSSDQGTGVSGQFGALGKAFAELARSPHEEAAADVVADCGRLGPDSPALALLPHAAVVLLVTRTQPENLAHTRERALALSARLHGQHRGAAQHGRPPIGLLLVTDPSQGGRIAGQVNEMLTAAGSGTRVAGLVAEDAAGADQLAGRRRGRVDKSLLVRSARKVVADLHQTYRELAPAVTGAHGTLPPPQPAGGAAAPPSHGHAPVPPQYGAQGPHAPAPAPPGGPWPPPTMPPAGGGYGYPSSGGYGYPAPGDDPHGGRR